MPFFVSPKVDYDTAESLLADLGEMAGVGTSLGSFSVDHAILSALLSEFSAELAAKEGKLDTDPHFWMPMTLPRDGYVSLMGQKGALPSSSPSCSIRSLICSSKSSVCVYWF